MIVMIFTGRWRIKITTRTKKKMVKHKTDRSTMT